MRSFYSQVFFVNLDQIFVEEILLYHMSKSSIVRKLTGRKKHKISYLLLQDDNIMVCKVFP